MAYTSKADQAAKSLEWYEANKALVLERKASRSFGGKNGLGTFKHRRALFELQQLSLTKFVSPAEAAEAASKICLALGFVDVGRAAFAIISRARWLRNTTKCGTFLTSATTRSESL